MGFSRIITFQFLLLISSHLLAMDSLELVEGFGDMDISTRLVYLEDPKYDITIEHLTRDSNSVRWSTIEGSEPHHAGISSSRYWYALRLKNLSSNRLELYLRYHYPPTDNLHIFLVRNKKIIKSSGNLGDLIPVSSRKIKTTFPLYKVRIEPSATAILYISISSSGLLTAPFSLVDGDELARKSAFEMGTRVIFYGILIAMIVYNLFIFLSLKDLNYLIYVLMVSCVLLLVMSIKGDGFLLLWPENPLFNSIANPLWGILSVSFIVLFGIRFLELRTRDPFLEKILRWLFIANIFLIPTLWLIPYSVALPLTTSFGMFQIFMCISAGVRVHLKGYRPAKYYVTAWFLQFGCSLLGFSGRFGLIPRNWITEYALLVGPCLEATYFSFALGSRMNFLKEQRHRAQQDALKMENEVNMNRSRVEIYDQFLAKNLTDRLATDPDLKISLSDILTPKTINASILQADIRGYSALFEDRTPVEVAQLVKGYYERTVLMAQKVGQVKVIGDCLFIFIEDEDKKSVKEIFDVAKLLVTETNRKNLSQTTPINFGIAIHYGEVVAGNLSSDQCIDYTIVGPNVNQTARMEELTKSPAIKTKIGLNGILVSNQAANFLEEPLETIVLKKEKVKVRSFPSIDSIKFIRADQICDKRE